MRTSFSRRELYALGEMLGDSVTRKEGGRIIYGGGGGGGSRAPAPTETTSTTYQTNIPEYAKPYVETMLQGTQKQLFQTAPNPVTGATEITGFQPYKAYGGTYDEQGNQISYDPGKAVAGFQPLQEAAQRGIAGMQTPGEFGQAADVTRAGISSAMGNYYMPSRFAAQQVGTQDYTGSNVGQYMSPYMQNVVDIQQREAQRQADIAGTQRAAQAVRSGAFGGSRAGLMDAEAARNLALQKGDIQAQGQQAAFQNAQQQFNAQQQANLQAQLANQGAGLQTQQMGEQSRQFGAGYGMQNLQAGLQGAQQLAGLGQAGLAAQQGIYNLQNTVGAQQQALEQQKINQAMTDYANAQQYPLMQLGTMSNMLRGLPMQAQTTNQYVAAPNAMTQAIGTAGSAASLYNALKAEGGVIKEKKMASGGITSVPRYDVGGEVYADLMKMEPEELQEQIKNSSSERVREMAKTLLKQKQMAGGGIVAFAGGGESKVNEGAEGEAEAKVGMEERLAQPPVGANEGILGAGLAPKPAAPTTGIGTLQAARDELKASSARSLEDIMAEKQAAYKAQGVEAPGVEQRAKLMAERANAEDEANRNRWMRASQFFAKWGSTPGPTLVAGMTAVRDSVPDMINDVKEAKKIRMEIDKSIAGLDEATRLEKKGAIDEAAAIKMKEAEKMQTLNLEIAKIQAQQEHDITLTGRQEKHDERMIAATRELEGIKNQNAKELERMRIEAGKYERNSDRTANIYASFMTHAQGVERHILEIMNKEGGAYQTALRDSKMDPSKSQNTADQVAAAKQTLRAMDEGFNKMRQDVATTRGWLENKLGLPTPKTSPTNKPTNEAMPALPPGAKLD